MEVGGWAAKWLIILVDFKLGVAACRSFSRLHDADHVGRGLD